MSPLESVLVILVGVQIFLFVILVVGMIILLLAFKKSIDKVNQILGNVENLTDDFGTTLRSAVTGLAMLAGKMGVDSVKRIISSRGRKKGRA